MGGVLRYKLEVYCQYFSDKCTGWGFLNSAQKFRKTREGCNCQFQKTPCTEGGVGPRFPAGLPFPGARNPRIDRASRFGKILFQQFFRGLSWSFPREPPNASHKQPKPCQVSLSGGRKIPTKSWLKEVPPIHFVNFNGAVCSNDLFSNTSVLTDSQSFQGSSACQGSQTPCWAEHFCVPILGPLPRTNFCLALHLTARCSGQKIFQKIALKIEDITFIGF